ncbi:sarcosine oxidase subunit gamma [Pseudogemmobacter sonorensis]|uniref:sarcosine oxidase subunit gamma n=1 Tax=Pseudogemmobacter sonorensis TaxID=2989681 RepID=UPI0036CB8329
MPDPVQISPVTPLAGAEFHGFARVREAPAQGMITLRARPGAAGLEAAVMAVTGGPLPAARQIVTTEGRSVGWMGPDEFLLLLPRDEVGPALRVIADAMAGAHHLAVDVSDARALLRIEGPRADQVLRKLTPADLDALAPGELRRSRLAQVAAAFWAAEGGFTLVCFRSVAGYVMDVLTHSAQPGAELS